MNITQMKAYKVNELNFVNEVENGTKIQFANKFSYNVKYSSDNVCIGELTAEMFDKNNPDKFGVKVVINGVFEFDTTQKKEVIHVQTFKELFPFARSIVASTSVNAGVPQIILPSFDIESHSIYKFEKNV